MPRIVYVLRDGTHKEIEAPSGTSVMKLALDNGIGGVDAECGGCVTCATCHVYVDQQWTDKLAEPSEEERVMIDCAIDVRPNSRLSCQITLTDELDGLIVQVPATQI